MQEGSRLLGNGEDAEIELARADEQSCVSHPAVHERGHLVAYRTLFMHNTVIKRMDKYRNKAKYLERR